MKFKLYRQYGALNSQPIFDAFERGVKHLGHEITDNNEDVSVIWSVLWQGRMKGNQQVYQLSKKINRPVVIIEVGNLKRGETWRISSDHVNGLGYFANQENLDPNRCKKIGIPLNDIRTNRNDNILLACQHEHSLQWEGMPRMAVWASNTVKEIRNYSQRPIVIRPHPRSSFHVTIPGTTVEIPRKLPNTYDNFNINYNYHCVVNYNSGPAIQSAINGIPVICNASSLAYPVSSTMDQIENIALPDRTDWFLKLCHTEWFADEIAQGIPLSRLLPKLESDIS